MNVYGTEQIRNVVLLGHGGAGKTTVAEAMALITGVTKRMGKVADGNTISDYDKEEIKRQFTTIMAASATLIASSTSPTKSKNPGVSSKLILTGPFSPWYSRGISVVEMENCLLISSLS